MVETLTDRVEALENELEALKRILVHLRVVCRQCGKVLKANNSVCTGGDGVPRLGVSCDQHGAQSGPRWHGQ